MIFILFVFIFHTVIAKERYSCKNPDDFPLFGNDLCVSRMLYTGLFLTSIILSSITVLLLIGLLLFYCTRRLTWSYNKHKLFVNENDDDDDSLSPILPKHRIERQISSVLTNIVNRNSIDELNEICCHHNYTIPNIESSLSDPPTPQQSNKISSKL